MKPHLIKFVPTEVAKKDGKQVFLWELTPKVKEEIESLLNIKDINYAWNKSCEFIPQFECHECGEIMTFADQIRGALKEMPEIHTADIFRNVFERKANFSKSNREHILYCKNGHKQIPVAGWPYETFDWTYPLDNDIV